MPVEMTQILSLLSFLVAAVALFRNFKLDTKENAGELTTVIVKLENIQNDVKEMKVDIKSDIKDMRADLDDMRAKLIIVEQSTKSAHKRLDGITNEHLGE